MPDYKTHDPKGWGGDPSRGAALGRPGIHDADRAAPVKLYLRQVRIDSGGYDPNGTYFGVGHPIYWYADADGEVDGITRAPNRDGAKHAVRMTYPKATFFR
jgi:hypothetical protein